MSLAGKVALVTGSSKGIGAAVAKNLAAQGASVVINFSSSRSAAEELVSTLPNPSTHLLLQGDVSSVPVCQQLVADTVAHYGRLDILVLNAGWMPTTDLGATTEAVFDRCYNTNVKAPFFLAQAAAKHLPDGDGRIVFFSTSLTAANILTPAHTLYVSTKGAVEQMVRGVSKDLGRRGIAVNCVSPGPTRTNMFLSGKPDHVVEMFAGLSPAGRIGEPEEVAAVVGFLCQKDAAWTMGQNIRVNGGIV